MSRQPNPDGSHNSPQSQNISQHNQVNVEMIDTTLKKQKKAEAKLIRQLEEQQAEKYFEKNISDFQELYDEHQDHYLASQDPLDIVVNRLVYENMRLPLGEVVFHADMMHLKNQMKELLSWQQTVNDTQNLFDLLPNATELLEQIVKCMESRIRNKQDVMDVLAQLYLNQTEAQLRGEPARELKSLAHARTDLSRIFDGCKEGSSEQERIKEVATYILSRYHQRCEELVTAKVWQPKHPRGDFIYPLTATEILTTLTVRDGQLVTHDYAKYFDETTEDIAPRCQMCRITFNSARDMNTHFGSAKHARTMISMLSPQNKLAVNSGLPDTELK